MRRALACLVVAVLAAGCGTEGASRLANRRASALVVVSGGNKSCQPGTTDPYGAGVWRALAELLGRSPDVDVSYVASCHVDDPTVHYVTSDAPHAVQSADFRSFFDRIDTMHADHRPDRLIVAGHSYGGWLAMKTGLALRADVTTLVTIDPISRVECSWTQPAGCLRAPRDMSPAEKRRLQERSGRWINWYQTETFYLRSSAIPEADENRVLRVGHTAIDTDPAVWTDLERAIFGS